MAAAPPYFQSVVTPNPSELAFRISVDGTMIFPSQCPKEGDAYKTLNTPFILPRVMQEGMGDYLYTYNEQDGGRMWYYFAKNKTDEEKDTPFETQRSYGNHPWPPILRALILLQDFSFPRATNVAGANGQQGIVNGPSYYVREVYVPDVDEGSLFILEEYFSPTPFLIPQHEAPVPSSVSYDVPGRSGSFPKCLHKKLVLPNARTGTAKVIGDTSAEVAGIVNGQIFPATNFVSWEPYITSDLQVKQGGGWYRKKITVLPPEEPTTVTNF